MFAKPSQWLFLGLLSLVAIAAAAVVQPSTLHQHQVDELRELRKSASLLDRRQSSNSNSTFTVVQGIQDTSPQPRLEIRELEKNVDQWNIFMLGLSRWMKTNQSEKLSFYQIAGIHGRPYIPWDGVEAAPGISSPGYCTHSTEIFLPWHRPYVALYEQTLYTHINAVVNEFPSGPVGARYAQAALSWRYPYWDWAAAPPANGSAFPASLTSPTIQVVMPNGTTTIDNPLYSYEFHPVSVADFYYDPWVDWNTTMRSPKGGLVSNAVSQDFQLPPIFDKNRVSFRDRLYNMFTYYNNYSQFSTQQWYANNPNISNADSIEALHNTVHGFVGNAGHMTYLDYSAFDPIFFLHHAMVDRVFALWQGLYPNSYVAPNAAGGQSYTIAQGQVVDGNTPLAPFHRTAAGDMWTANQVRSTRTFGYYYPELSNANINSSALKTAINNLYGSAAGQSGVQLSKRFFHDEPAEAAKRDTNGYRGPPKRREFIANIVSDKHAELGSYAIYVFLGDFDASDPSCWATSPNLVGAHGIFASLPQEEAQVKTDMQVAGTMPLTSAIIEKFKSGEIKSLKPQEVEAWLAENLKWRAAMFNGTEIPLTSMPNLNVTVVGADVTPASRGDQFPQWGNWNALNHVTDGSGPACSS